MLIKHIIINVLVYAMKLSNINNVTFHNTIGWFIITPSRVIFISTKPCFANFTMPAEGGLGGGGIVMANSSDLVFLSLTFRIM